MRIILDDIFAALSALGFIGVVLAACIAIGA